MKNTILFFFLLLAAAVSAQSNSFVTDRLRAAEYLRIGTNTSQKVTGFDRVITAPGTHDSLPTSRAVVDFLEANFTPIGYYTAGTGISISDDVITNAAPDQVVGLTGGGITVITGTYPNFTITSTEVDGSTTNELQNLSLSGQSLSISSGTGVTLPVVGVSAGTGIGVSGSGGTFTVSNTGDLSATNEIQTLSIAGSDLSLSGGGGMVTIPLDSAWTDIVGLYRDINTFDTINRTGPAIAPIWDKGGNIYNVAAYGIHPGGPTGPDLTAKFMALLDTVARNHGGIIQFNRGIYRIDGQITIPYVKPLTSQNPGAYDRSPSIYIRGAGCYKTAWNTNPDTIKGTVLYMKFNDGLTNRDTLGMIHARGIGFLELSDLNLVADDTTKTAFLLINYTTCHIHNVAFWGSGRAYSGSQAQDAIVCGGDANPQVVNTYNTHFAGYGTTIENCYFYGIRRAWWARAYTNNVVFKNNTIWYQNKGEACVELSTNIPGNVVGGNLIIGNTAEVDGYKYFIKLGKLANANTIIGNGIYDPTTTTRAFIYVDSLSENNQIFAGYWDTDKFFETTGDRQYIKDRNSFFMNNTADTTTLGSSFYIGGNSVFRKSVYVREGLNVNYINPYNIRLRPQSLSNYFDLAVDGSYLYLSSNEFNNILKVHKSALSGAMTIDQFGGTLFNRTAYNNNAGSYIHPEGRAIFKQSVYVNYNWDGANSYQLKVGGPSLLAGQVDISTTSGGLIPPRLTTTQRNALTGVVAGTTLYCTDCTATDGSTGVMQVYNGSVWKNCW